MKLLFLLMSLAQEPAVTSADEPSGKVEGRTVDEITVYGEKSTPKLRDELIAAEDDVFALFNKLNKDNAYDIICKRETRIGSQIPKRVCLTRMYRDALAAKTEDEEGGIVDGDDFTGTSVFVSGGGSARQQRILMEKMRTLARENPELLKALRNRLAAQIALDAAREK